MHIPVLLKEAVDALDLKKGDTVIDGTAGGGGHAREIRKRIGSQGNLLLVDWDPENAAALEKETKYFSNIHVVEGNYADLPDIMRRLNFPKAQALILDLGFSSEQLARGRGFSFEAGQAPLTMTYSLKSEPLAKALRRLSVKELTEIISKFGEERYARRIAEAIKAEKKDLRTVGDLVEAIKKAVPKSYERGRINPATRTFQAFRIYINNELSNLERVLGELPMILSPGSRIAVISFHSLEDRIVKTYFNELEKKGFLEKINKKPITASDEEIKINPRSRSAKLRIAVMKK